MVVLHCHCHVITWSSLLVGGGRSLLLVGCGAGPSLLLVGCTAGLSSLLVGGCVGCSSLLVDSDAGPSVLLVTIRAVHGWCVVIVMSSSCLGVVHWQRVVLGTLLVPFAGGVLYGCVVITSVGGWWCWALGVIGGGWCWGHGWSSSSCHINEWHQFCGQEGDFGDGLECLPGAGHSTVTIRQSSTSVVVPCHHHLPSTWYVLVPLPAADMAFLHHLDGVQVCQGGCQWSGVMVMQRQWVGIMDGCHGWWWWWLRKKKGCSLLMPKSSIGKCQCLIWAVAMGHRIY